MTIIWLGCSAQMAEYADAFEKLLVAETNHSGHQSWPVFYRRTVATQTGVNL